MSDTGPTSPLIEDPSQPLVESKSRRRWLLPTVIGAAVVVIAVIVVGVLLNAPKTFVARDLQAFTINDDEAPGGGYSSANPGFASGEVSQALPLAESTFVGVNGHPADCEQIALYVPVTAAADGSSTDLLKTIGAYADGTTTIFANARLFADEAGAEKQLAATATAVDSCAAGYGTDGFEGTDVAAFDPNLPAGVTATAWTEMDTSEGVTYYDETIEMRHANMVVRVGCFLPSQGNASTQACTDWRDTVAKKLAAL